MGLEMDDDALLDAIARGDREAQDLLVRRHARTLVTEARRLGARRYTFDLANEILTQAFEQPLRVKRHGFLPWATERMEAVLEQWRRQEFDHLSSSKLVSLSTSLSQRVARAEVLEDAQDAVERLPEADQAVLALVYDEGLSTADAARVLGLRPSSLRARLSRARDRLAKLLRSDDGDEPT